MGSKYIIRVDYSEEYGYKNQLTLNKTVLYDNRDYTPEEIEEAIQADTIDGLLGVISCNTSDFEQCFRSLINKEDN